MTLPRDDRSCMKTETFISEDELTKTIVEYGLHRMGDQPPYFAITVEQYERETPRGRWPKEPVACGAMHEDILALEPKFAPLVDLHLADVDGVPMYAVENGWYWFDADAERLKDNREMASRTPAERAGAYLNVDPAHFEDVTTKERFEAIVESLKPLFAIRAAMAIETFDLDVPGTSV